MSKPNKYANTTYDKRASRQSYLEDRITQMGHDPGQYEIWHKELEALKKQKEKEKWPGQWGDKTSKEQWQKIEYAIGCKLMNATDGQLAHAIKAANDERKRRIKRRKELREKRLEAKIARLTANGYLPLETAGKDICRIIQEHKIFTDLGSGRPYESEIKAMVRGVGAFRSYPPMRSGVLHDDKKSIYVQPKALLCFVINRIQDKIAEEAEARNEVERRKKVLKEWEEIQKARSAKVAKEWHQQMKEQNGRFRQALAEHGISTVPVPTDEPTQSLPNTDHKVQNK
ncbi:hypothetical protein [uncultured Mediterranean phage uvMED]|nr:hypothetical protein [uncultured Mediterranean phage uvMED]